MKKIICICTALWCLAGQLQGMAMDQLPNEFKIIEHWFSWTTDFSIVSNDIEVGVVHRQFFSLAPLQYDFNDNNGNLQAKGRARWFSWGTVFDVTDADEFPLGRVEEEFAWFFPTFRFISPSETIQAEISLNFWRTTYTTVDPVSKQVIAEIHRNFFRLKDDWTVKIVDRDLFVQKQIDPRFFVLVAAYTTDAGRASSSNTITATMSTKGSSKQKAHRQHQLEALRYNLEPYRSVLNIAEVTEADVEFVDQFVTAKMSESKTSSEIQESSLDPLEEGFAVSLPLFEGNELSHEQKSALFLMLEHLLNTK